MNNWVDTKEHLESVLLAAIQDFERRTGARVVELHTVRPGWLNLSEHGKAPLTEKVRVQVRVT